MRNKIKLLVVAPYFYPAIGGIEKHVYEIAKRLVRDHRIEVAVVTSNHRRKEYSEEKISGMKVYRLPYWFKLSNTPINPLWYFQIREIIRKEEPDVINGRAPVPFMADISALTSGEIPFVLGYHFPSMRKGQYFADILIRIYESFILKFMLNKAKLIICSSDFVRLNFLRNYSDKTITITQGIDRELFKPRKVNVRDRVLFVGNFTTEIKGLFYLLKAIELVKNEIRGVKLVIVGPGNFSYYKKLCGELRIVKNVIFKGTLYGENLVEEYQQTNVLVLPSLGENFPNVLLEAMACKKPVIGTNIGGVPDIIDDEKTGLLIPPKNPEVLADAIVRILNDEKLAKKLAKNGYQKIRNNFNWDEQTRKTKEVIKKVLN